MQLKQRFLKTRLQHYTKHVLKIGAKWPQDGAKSGPGAVPETPPKKNSKNCLKVDQKVLKVDQEAPQNDPQKNFRITKNGLGCFSTSKNDGNLEAVFPRFLLPPAREVPDPQAKTI